MKRLWLMAILFLGTFAQDNFFDGRIAWKDCLTTVYDRTSVCQSSWAHAISGLVSDRFCIMKKQKVALSPEDWINCNNQNNCNGKFDIEKIFKHIEIEGVVTRECLPYTAKEDACLIKDGKCAVESVELKKYKCGAMKKYKGEAAIKNEIKKGPVMCFFDPTKDFLDYYDGIYYHAHTKKPLEYPLAFKLLGYGIENGMHYWIAENSLGDKYGENGYLRLLSSVCGEAYTCDPQQQHLHSL